VAGRVCTKQRGRLARLQASRLDAERDGRDVLCAGPQPGVRLTRIRPLAPTQTAVGRSSLPPGIAARSPAADSQHMSSAASTKAAAAGSPRLIADVKAFDSREGKREPALSRLEEALGRDFADRLVAALSTQSKR